MSDRFVATDADGLQHHEGYRRRWPLAGPRGGRLATGRGRRARRARQLRCSSTRASCSRQLGECVFAAEPVGRRRRRPALSPARPGRRRRRRSSRSTASSTSWRSSPAAPTPSCPGGGTLGAIIASARQYLDDRHRYRHPQARLRRRGSPPRGGCAARARRSATPPSRRPRRPKARASTSWSDPAWETLAAARDAVLAAVEAVRHVAFPFLADRETRRYEAHEERKAAEGRRGGHALGPLRRRRRGPEVRAVVGRGPRRGGALTPGCRRPRRPGGGRGRAVLAGRAARGAARRRIGPAPPQVA